MPASTWVDEEVRVAVGILFNAHGKVLLTRRPDHVHQGGLWEFPGGKVEAAETIQAALQRELREELGITVLSARPLIRIRHTYPDKRVLLDVWRVDRYEGEPQGLEAQPLRWAVPDVLNRLHFPAADVPIINALRLPSLYLITGNPVDRPAVFLQRLERSLERGIRLLQLRAGQLPAAALLNLYRQAKMLAKRYEATVLLNGSPEQVLVVQADGVHLSARRLLELQSRPLPADRWVAASCHNEAELRHACRLGLDFVAVSPVKHTRSHPDTAPLGWEGLQTLTEMANLPAYALGGMTPDDLEQAWHHGAQGIAAIRSLWNNEGEQE
ncbi:MAG: Nudix family hydrolase [Candidatus Competibacteraceae bacterium]